MNIQEQVKKNRPALIKAALVVGVAWYLSNKYKVVRREEFNSVCCLLGTLRDHGYIEVIDNKFIRIVEGLTKV